MHLGVSFRNFSLGTTRVGKLHVSIMSHSSSDGHVSIAWSDQDAGGEVIARMGWYGVKGI